MTSTIYLVEDHPIVRRMLNTFIGRLPDLTVCGVAGSGEEALERLAEVKADLVLINLALPTMSGIELIGEIREHWPDLRCLVLSGHREATYVDRAFKTGARGYILKGNPYELHDAIRQVLDGHVYLSEPLRMA